MKPRSRNLLLVGVLAGGVGMGVWLWANPEHSEPKVIIKGHEFTVELATTQAQRSKGLMGRTELAEDRGMLFIFGTPQSLGFYMKNCEIPIDVAFIDADKRIVKIHTMAVEYDRAGSRTYHSDVPVQYALEVGGGVLGKLGIKEGDIVNFSANVPSAAKADR